ncbi:MAG: hypothetical protein MZV64_28425 [Ignavibacteriales bacterium]|nr:hypothetical protein [Ignavibacteriales bacterium]
MDDGRRRIGLAVSDPTGTLARPAETVAGHDDPAAAAREVAAATPADRGRRRARSARSSSAFRSASDGTPNEQTDHARALAAELHRLTGLERRPAGRAPDEPRGRKPAGPAGARLAGPQEAARCRRGGGDAAG